MAVIFGVFDPSADSRAAIRSALPPTLTGLNGLERKSVTHGACEIYWEAPQSTPISFSTDRSEARDRFAFVCGDFKRPYSRNSNAAVRLLSDIPADDGDYRGVSGQDGFYLACVFDADRKILALGVDTLGHFPLYYWQSGDVFLFGTSPSLFKAHPTFCPKVSEYALVSILMLNFTAGGHSIFKDVRRNAPGHLVQYSQGNRVREIEANRLQFSDERFDRPYPSVRDEVLQIMDNFHAPLSAEPKLDLLLSGGQDSRLIAGFIAKHSRREAIRCVSIGNRHDQELNYAHQAAGTLGFQHRFSDADSKNATIYAFNQLRLESLQGPFTSFENGTTQFLLSEQQGTPAVSGYVGDAVIGDRHIMTAIDPRRGEFSLSELVKNIRRYGYEDSDVLALLGGTKKHVIDEINSDLHKEWSSINAENFQRAWYFVLTNRQRFHVGSVSWRLTLGNWQLLPYLNRNLLECIASVPLNYLKDRRIQADLIRREFPRLATLPLDRNAGVPDYLTRTAYRRFVEGLPRVSDISWRLHRLLSNRVERRYYFRVFDFNGEAWRNVRRMAETYRAAASPLLSPEAVQKLLPSPDATVAFKDGIIDSAKTKTLAGVVLWNGLEQIAS